MITETLRAAHLSSAGYLIALATLLAASTPAQVLEEIIVNVNGEILTKRDLEERQVAAIAHALGRDVAITELRSDVSLQQSVEAMTPRILVDAVDELIVLQHAAELGLDATDADVDNVLAAIKKDNNLETEGDLWSFLRAAGMGPSARRESVRRKILAEQIRQHVVRTVRVSDDQARAYFEANRHMFATPASVVYREIFVPIPPEPPLTAGQAAYQARDNAMMRFVAARDRILRGEPFAEVAARSPEIADGVAAALVGPVVVSELPAHVQAALSRLRQGDVSPPIKTDDGYRLLMLETIVPASSPSFEAIRESAIDRASADLRLAATRRYMARLRETALIAWKNKELQELYERHHR